MTANDAPHSVRPEVAAFLDRVSGLDLRPRPYDEHRTEYPTMPAGTCYLSSRVLPEAFPELSVAFGRVGFWIGEVYAEFDHA